MLFRSASIDAPEVAVEAGTFRGVVPLAGAFTDVPAGELVLLEDSYGALALAVNGGSARERCGVEPGETIVVAAR